MTAGQQRRRVVITGGSGAIGQALCAAFARGGADVAFTWYLNHQGRDQTAALISEAGGTPLPIRASLRDKSGVGDIVSAVLEAWGGVDVVISNAATGVLKPALDFSDKHWRAVMDVNALAFLKLAQGFAPHMPAGGRFMALSSAGATHVIDNYALVGASKAALESLARHLAAELGPKGITVNVLSPGVVDTPALDHFPNREQLLQVAQMRTPNGRLCTPKDVADVALLLASPQASMIQGQTIVIDGGYSVLA